MPKPSPMPTTASAFAAEIASTTSADARGSPCGTSKRHGPRGARGRDGRGLRPAGRREAPGLREGEDLGQRLRLAPLGQRGADLVEVALVERPVGQERPDLEQDALDAVDVAQGRSRGLLARVLLAGRRLRLAHLDDGDRAEPAQLGAQPAVRDGAAHEEHGRGEIDGGRGRGRARGLVVGRGEHDDGRVGEERLAARQRELRRLGRAEHEDAVARLRSAGDEPGLAEDGPSAFAVSAAQPPSATTAPSERTTGRATGTNRTFRVFTSPSSRTPRATQTEGCEDS